MSNLINRQDAIDAIDKRRLGREAKNDYEFGCETMLDWAEFMVENLPSTQQWIPCSERLPEEGCYLVTIRDKKRPIVDIDIFTTSKYEWTEIGDKVIKPNGAGKWEYGGDIIAWMPLPEPYEGVEE